MRFTTDLHAYLAMIYLAYNRYVFFVTGIDRVGNQLLHLFSATYDWNLGVNHLVNDIAAMAAFIKFCCHIKLNFPYLFK